MESIPEEEIIDVEVDEAKAEDEHYSEDDEELLAEEEDDDLCPICSDIKMASTTTFVCEHSFCQRCIVGWYQNCVINGQQPSCPMCRKIDNIWGSR